MRSGDAYIILLIMLILFAWIYILLRRRYNEQAGWQVPEAEELGELDPDIVDLLEQAGFALIGGRQRIPIRIRADGERMESRVIIDGLAERDEELYIIRIARERRPMEWTGSSIRDHLLPVQLLYRNASGIIYVNPKSGFLHQIRFEIDV